MLDFIFLSKCGFVESVILFFPSEGCDEIIYGLQKTQESPARLSVI